MLGEPFIPENITVHLGRPDDANAMNVTVSFPDYIKNVASSELYPTWPENALRANIYAIISFALNRVYTEWYRSKGYNFDITNTTQYDQYFVSGRDIFQPINDIVDEIFNNYIRRQGSVEPLFAQYCDGVQTQCEGMTQWGSVYLANQGYIPYNILTYYYGDDIDIVRDAPISPLMPSYPGRILTEGSAGDDVMRIQTQLNRISQNYPAIPKIEPVSGAYFADTADAVRTFQQIFNLPQTGNVDKATWYKINFVYVSVKNLAELKSEGLKLEETSLNFPQNLSPGDSGNNVKQLQYYLQVVSAYYDAVPLVSISGVYDDATENAVRAFQQLFGLPMTGVTDSATWEDIYRAYQGIIDSVPVSAASEEIVLYPNEVLREGMSSDYVRVLQEYLTYIHNTYPQIPEVSNTGYFGPVTRNAVIAFQKLFGLQPTGTVGALVWNEIASVYSRLRFGYVKAAGQYPGYVIR
ncbi:MAG: peptidoglycan-binding protein [Huintestinicola sp.]